MDKLSMLVKEYVAITKHLQATGDCIMDGSVLCIPKTKIVGLLNKNPYMSANYKLACWRDLGWISFDPGRYTKRRYTENGYRRLMQINLLTAQTLEALMVPLIG